jgi:hypothetical protein
MRSLASLGRALLLMLVSASCGGGASSPDLGQGSFQMSACGSCVQTACGQPIQSCSADSGCAAWFACIEACPAGTGGDADAQCEAACTVPSSPSGASARQAVVDCRLTGAGTQCPCGHTAPLDMSMVNPLLTQMCSPSTETKPCYVCEDERCCNSEAGCHNDPDCAALQACEKSCQTSPPDGGTTDTCVYGCLMNAPKKAVAELNSLITCVEALCVPQCGTVDLCTACELANCQDALIACGTDADCSLIIRCGALCATGDVTCINACQTMFPAGQAKFNALISCAANVCAGQCG